MRVYNLERNRQRGENGGREGGWGRERERQADDIYEKNKGDQENQKPRV